MPKMGDGMEEGTILRWLKREGDAVAAEEAIAEIETDKANVEIPAEEAGILARIEAAEGDTVPVGGVIAYIGDGAPAVAGPPSAAPSPETRVVVVSRAGEAVEAPTSATSVRVRATPLARSMARRMGLDIAQVRRTGAGGARVVAADVMAFSKTHAAAPAQESAAPSAPQTPEGDLDLTKMRRAIARRTVQSKQGIPHFYIVMPVEMDRALDVLAQMNAATPGAKVTVNDLVVKAVADALTKYPDVNVSFTAEERIRRHSEVNIGIAVGTDDGLRIPVLHDCGGKSLRALSETARRIIARTRSGAITPQEMSGGTFTVSNLGMFGVEEFAAIINPPESAILAVGAIAAEVQVADSGAFVARKRMRLTLSCDHRTVDGLLGARFLQEVRRLLENPVEMIAA